MTRRSGGMLLAALISLSVLATGCLQRRPIVLERDANAAPVAPGVQEEPAGVRGAALLRSSTGRNSVRRL